jgi:hypothetical protein
LTLEQASAGTGLTSDAIAALESDLPHRLTRGAYGEAYRRTYALFLERVSAGDTAAPTVTGRIAPATWPGAPDDDPEAAESPAERPPPRVAGSPRVPSVGARGAGRAAADDDSSDLAVAEREAADPAVAGARLPLPFVRALAAITTLVALGLGLWKLSQLWPDAQGQGPIAVVVKIKLQRNARLAVTVDGQVVQDREFAGREEATFQGRERVAIDVPSVDALRVWFNDRPIDPRGQVGTPRTLVFLPGGDALR